MNMLTRDRVVPTISRERLLADLRYDRLRLSLLAEIRHQQEHPRQTLLARIEKLIDQVLLDSGVPRQQVRHEHLGKLRLVVEHAHDGRLFDPHDDAFRHRRDRRQAQRLSGQAALAEEVPLPVERDDRFLPLLGDDADLDLALLNVKDGIRRVALREDFLILAIVRYGPPAVHGAEEGFHVERLFFLFALATTPSPSPVPFEELILLSAGREFHIFLRNKAAAGVFNFIQVVFKIIQLGQTHAQKCQFLSRENATHGRKC